MKILYASKLNTDVFYLLFQISSPLTIVPRIFSVCIVYEQGASDTVILSSWSCIFNCLLTAQHGQGVRSQPQFDFSVMTRLSPLCVVFPFLIISQYRALARKLIFFYFTGTCIIFSFKPEIHL